MRYWRLFCGCIVILLCCASSYLPNLVAAPIYEGYFDGVTCDKIYGWAWDKNQPNSSVNVSIWDGTSFLAVIPANEFRSDLPGNKNHAFNYSTPDSLKDGQNHSIRITIDNTYDLINSPKIFNSVCGNKPNLTPYNPPNWSDKIVVSRVSGTNLDSYPINATDSLYVDWAVINNGTISTSSSFSTYLYVDGNYKQSWLTSSSLSSNSSINFQDYAIGSLLPGQHMIKIVTDATGAIAESNESDNEYIKTVNVLPPPEFSVSILPLSKTVAQGGTVTYTITLQSLYGFSGNVGLSAYGLPNNPVVPGTDFSPQTVSVPANGSASSTLTITTNNSSTIGTSTFYVEGASGALTRSASASLTITCGPPSIIAQPVDQQIHSGHQAGLLVSADGTNPLSYQWYQGLAGTTSNPVGDNSASYTTVPLTLTTTYWVRVSNSCGSIDSRTVTVNVVHLFEGYFDEATCDRIYGWAWDKYQPDDPINVVIWDGTHAVDTVPADKFRSDLPGNKNHAFEIATPASLKDDVTHSIRVTISGYPSIELTDSPKSLMCTPTDAMELIGKTPPDGTVIGTNTFFSTTWRLKNTGGTTWNSSYLAVWIETPVDGHESSNLMSPLGFGKEVPSAAPGTEVPLSVTMIAPPDPGIYYMYWQLQNGNHVFFGPKFYVQIVASQAGNESFGSDTEDFGNGDSPGSNVGVNDESLNTATGNLNYRVTDLIVPGRGMDFVFARSYNSQDPTDGPMGPGWSHSFNLYLGQSPDADMVTLHYGDGKVLTCMRTSGNIYKPRATGYYDTLTKNGDGTWTLFKPDQREFHFNNQLRLSHIRDRNGNQITLLYGTDNNLERVVDTVGREFFFTYTNSLLTDITDPISRHLKFEYPGNKLTVFRDAKNNPNKYSYDSAGRLSEVINGRNLRIMTNSYDAQGRLVSQVNGRNFQWSIAYDDSANTTTITDPKEKKIVYSRDSFHRLSSFTNRLDQQNKVRIDYDANHNRSSVNDPNSLSNIYSYLYDDRNGYVKKSTDPDLKTRSFVYDARNNPTHATDELNHTTVMGYDANGNLSSITDALNNATAVNHNTYGQPTSITDPNLNMTELDYDAQGNLIRVENAEHNVTQYGYDAVGRRTSVTDARNKITRFIYDDNDNLASVQRPIGTTAYTYDEADNLVSVQDPAQNLTTFEYDANNNLVKEMDATRVFYVQHTYDELDRRISTRDQRDNTTMFEYDPEGRLISVTDPMLNKTSYSHDGNGNRVSVTDANNQTTNFTYDKLNRLKSVRDSLNNTITKEYDEAGRLTSETDARGNITRYKYDETNNLIQVDDAEAGVTKYNYDKNHNLREQIDPNIHTSRFTYDKANRLVLSFDPLDNRYDYEYDGVGNRILQTDAKRQIIRFEYDDNNRLIKIIYPNSMTVQLGYDINGNLKEVIDPLGTTTYNYDQLNRVISYTDVYGKTISYEYDPNGNVIKLTYPDGKQVQYTYDKNNRMTSLTDWGNMTVNYEYNSINLLKKVTPPSGSANGATTYSYDLAGRLTGMTNLHTQGPNNTYEFTLDRNGNRTAANIQEPLNNRIAVITQSYDYDRANRINSAGTSTFTFDANGNMTGKTESGVTTTYTYDFNDRLTSDQTNTFSYNGQGIRVAKSYQGSVTRYVVDVNRELSQVLCETDENGNITSYYVYGQGLVYKVLPNGTHYYYQFDPNGSTVSMSTTAMDSPVNRYAYDPYGKITNSVEEIPNSNDTVHNPFRFGGRFGLMDDDNGLLYVRARYYSPELGRFLTKDPLSGDIQDGQSLNRYMYALGNPVKLVDADGMKPGIAEVFSNWRKNYLTRSSFEILEQKLKKRALKDLTKSGSLALAPALEVGKNWDKSNMDITEKLARGAFSLGRTAFVEIPVIAVSPLCGPAAPYCAITVGSAIDTYADSTFEKAFAARKRDIEPLGQWTYNTFWIKPPESSEAELFPFFDRGLPGPGFIIGT